MGFNAWSFTRKTLEYGCAIECDSKALNRNTEQHSSALDARAKVLSLELEQSSNWQTIETAPRTGKWILLWWPDVTDAPFVGYWCEVKHKWVDATSGSGWGNVLDPTHWQPLPPPPKEQP